MYYKYKKFYFEFMYVYVECDLSFFSSCRFLVVLFFNAQKVGIMFQQTWKHHFSLKVLLFSKFRRETRKELFPFISNSLQLLRQKLL